MNLSELVDLLFGTYPMVLGVPTGVLIIATVVIAPFYLLLLLGVTLYGFTKRDTPLVWNRPDDYDYSFKACYERDMERKANAKQR